MSGSGPRLGIRRSDRWRIVRGGSFFHNVNLARADARYGRFLDSDYHLDLVGFRCCLSAVSPSAELRTSASSVESSKPQAP